jgi:O-acetyl-ADP-ribose deacetylase (regulator of RNase III)
VNVDFVDVSLAKCEALRQAFPESSVHHGRFEDVVDRYDVMVSPANSYGLMDGGIDAGITAYFGERLMRDVQQRIIEAYQGEQPVGTCLLVPIVGRPTRWLAHTPTMQVPLDISWTTNVYFAMKALLREVAILESESGKQLLVLCPALGTGTGRVPPAEAARQMALALRNHSEHPSSGLSWDFAMRRYGDLGVFLPPQRPPTHGGY